MTTLIMILLLFALFHFVYEGMIAPTERQHIRYKLFALRDELRMIKIDEGYRFPNEIFEEMENTINTGINLVPRFSMGFLAKSAIRARDDKSALHEIARRRHIINNFEITRIKEIHKEAHNCLSRALTINSGGWLPYIVCALILWFVYFAFNKFKRSFNKVISLQIERQLHSKVPEMPEYLALY